MAGDGDSGPLLLGLFLIWAGLRCASLWRRPPATLSSFDCTLSRAASIAIGLLIAHSILDYPMRTDAIMAVFAVCCAFLLEPLGISKNETRSAAAPAHEGIPAKAPRSSQATKLLWHCRCRRRCRSLSMKHCRRVLRNLQAVGARISSGPRNGEIPVNRAEYDPARPKVTLIAARIRGNVVGGTVIREGCGWVFPRRTVTAII